MNEELEAPESNNTWEITDLHMENKLLGASGSISDGRFGRNKSRLVVLGNRQKYGIDYEEIFAPVAKM